MAIDRCAAVIFIADYLLRLFTADLKLGRGALSFLIYPFTPMAIIDLLCILPSFAVLSGGFRVLNVLRLFRTFRVFRAFKALRYSKSLTIIVDVIREQKEPLLAVCTLAACYVLISALVIFNVEPDSFWPFFRRRLLGYRESHYGRLRRHLSRLRCRPHHHDALLHPWHSRRSPSSRHHYGRIHG